jgi:hypothetical protein
MRYLQAMKTTQDGKGYPDSASWHFGLGIVGERHRDVGFAHTTRTPTHLENPISERAWHGQSVCQRWLI